MKSTLAASFIIAGWLCSGPLCAQPFPTKPLRLVAVFAPGGSSDIIARRVGVRLSELLGEPVLIENRVGAGGQVGTEYVARALPDGHTMLFGGSFITLGASLYRKLGYDPIKDLAPVGLIVSNQYLLVVHPSLPARSVKDLIALARARPGVMNFASSGQGTPPQLSAALLNSMAKLDTVNIPYKGGAEAMNAVLSGEVSYYFGGLASTLPQVASGKLRALAVTGAGRSRSLPAIATVAESGVPEYEVSTWFGLMVPGATPAGIIRQLNTTLNRALNEPEFQTALVKLGLEPVISTPEEFAVFYRKDFERSAKLVKAAGVVAQ